MKEKFFKYVIDCIFKKTYTYETDSGLQIMIPYTSLAYEVSHFLRLVKINNPQTFVMYPNFRDGIISEYGVHMKDTEELIGLYFKRLREDIDRLPVKYRITRKDNQRMITYY